ncbi:putative methyltransferase DDB_G0268948 [Styela clava]
MAGHSSALLRFFEGRKIAKFYDKNRPPYPSIVSNAIMKYVHSKTESNIKGSKLCKMLDVGCGGGQSIHSFAEYFDSLLGIDISEAQIDFAKEHNSFKNVDFRVVNNNLFPVEDETVDLVTCASTAHWLNVATFEKECNRVLKTGGCTVPKLCKIVNL